MLERLSDPLDELPRLREFFSERRQLGALLRRRSRVSDQLADACRRQFRDPPQAGKGGRGHPPLPARDGERLDPQCLRELLLGQVRAAPRRPQTRTDSTRSLRDHVRRRS